MENLLEIYQVLAVNPCLIVFAEVAEEGLGFVFFATSLSEEVSPKLYNVLLIFFIQLNSWIFLIYSFRMVSRMWARWSFRSCIRMVRQILDGFESNVL